MKNLILYKKTNKHLIYLFFLFLLFILVLILYTEDEDSYELIGLKNSNDTSYIDIIIPYNKVNIFEEKNYIIYNHEKHIIKDIKYGEITIIDNTPYINISLKPDFELEKEVIDFHVFYNRQRIINKIKNIIKEG